MCLAFAEHGADVIVADIREEPALENTPTHEKIEAETSAQAAYVECDATRRDDVEAAVDAAEVVGGIDIMVNNVGQSERDFDFLDLPDEEYERIMDLNLRSAYLGSQIAGRRMVERGEGCIINMSSVDGIQGESAVPIYSASKGGIRLLTYSLAGTSETTASESIRYTRASSRRIRRPTTTGTCGPISTRSSSRRPPSAASDRPTKWRRRLCSWRAISRHTSLGSRSSSTAGSSRRISDRSHPIVETGGGCRRRTRPGSSLAAASIWA